MQPWGRRAVVLAAVVVVASPALRPGTPDGFPLSTYPMFTQDRSGDVELGSVVAVAADGSEHRLDPVLVGGTDQVMVAALAITRAVDGGSASVHRLCTEVAGRVAALDDGSVDVEVRTEVHDPVAWFAGDTEPRALEVHERCPVPR